MTTRLVRNAWYVAAWQSEVGREPYGATILGDPVVLFRQEDGEIVALADQCPHRFAPLHRGRVMGNAIQCGYHGLAFDRTGACVHNPVGNGTVPGVAKLRSYPIAERNRLVWIWMGDATKIDLSVIPDFDWLDQPGEYVFTNRRTMVQPVGYELIVDNLLDLTHGAFLHPTTLGNEALARGTATVRQVGDRIHYDRWNPDGEPIALFQTTGAAGASNRVDYWNDMRWDPPGAFYLEIGITKVGADRAAGVRMGSVHLLTPIDDTTTVYRWLLFRNFAKDSEDVTRNVEALVEYAFREEDEPMLRAVQAQMAGRDFWEMQPLLLPSDKAAVLARRTLKRLAEAELAPEAEKPLSLVR